MKLVYLLLAVSLLSACNAGSGEGLDGAQPPTTDVPDDGTPPAGDTPPQPDQPDEPDSPDEDGLQPTLTSLQENVLTPICAQCHFGANAPVGLRMDSVEASRQNLIDVDASNPLYKRVLVGDAQNSYLYLKLIGDPVAGNRMPLGQAPLPDETIAVFRQWIDQGAQITDAPVVSASLTSVSNEGQELLLSFSQSIDVDTLSGAQIGFNLSDNSSAQPNYQTRWLDQQHLQIVLDNRTSVNRIVVNDPSLNSVLGTNGVLLDGDRDGKSGGIFIYEIPDS